MFHGIKQSLQSAFNATTAATRLHSTRSARSTDVESQADSPKRPSVSEALRQFSSSVSRKIPSYWKAGVHNELRNAQQIDEHPQGFPRFAAWMNSDENFLMARRYGLLHTRVLLYRQSELRELEIKLRLLDESDQKAQSNALKDRQEFDRGDDDEDAVYRRELIQDIDTKLKEYDDVVMRTRNMASLPKASTRNYNSLYNYIHNNAPLSNREQKAFMNDQDFAALVDPEEAVTVDAFIKDVLCMFPRSITKRIFASPHQRNASEDENLSLYSKRRIDTFVRILIAMLAVSILMIPVVVLFRNVDSSNVMIVVILCFTSFFSVALSLFTRARRAEVFAATAAYCAVLVVFLGNLIPQNEVAS